MFESRTAILLSDTGQYLEFIPDFLNFRRRQDFSFLRPAIELKYKGLLSDLLCKHPAVNGNISAQKRCHDLSRGLMVDCRIEVARIIRNLLAE